MGWSVSASPLVAEGEGGVIWESGIKTHPLSRVKQIASGNLLYDTGSSNSVFYDNLEGRIGMGSGSMVQEGEDICVPMADSCLFMAETNTIL